MSEENKENSGSKKEALELMRERFLEAEEYWADIKSKALDDLKFRAGDQWPEDVKKAREVDHRPCLVINRLPQYIRQVTNEQRQNRPSIKVYPVDDKADVETAKILQGLIRNIEHESKADIAYDSSFEGAVEKSFGFFRITTKYCDPNSFNQDILIEQIPNHFSVYPDTGMNMPDGSDARWGFIVDELSKEEFKLAYPDAELTKLEDWSSIGDNTFWITEGRCRVVEYFYIESEVVKKSLLQDGSVVKNSDLTEGQKALVVDERDVVENKVHWAKSNGGEFLDETIFPGRYIPIIPVFGQILIIDGKKTIESLIRHSKDPQKMDNYWASSITEQIALAPRAPFIVAEGQIPPEYEQIWKSANIKNHAYLPYIPTSIEGQPVPAPQRNAFEPPIAAASQARLQAAEDLKATTGIYDAALGNRSNESSGVAIQRRKIQSQTSNFHFFDNLVRSMRHAGRIIVEIIPEIYDSARAIRILAEDGEQEIVRINEMFNRKGKDMLVDFSVGKYDVVVETGPSFATRREEAALSMIEAAKAIPQLNQVAPDLIVKNMDWPGSQDMFERLKKTLPPGLIDQQGEQDIPENVRAEMAQMEQMITQLSQNLQMATEAMKTKKMELESKERIELAKLDTQMAIAQANNESKEALAGFQQQFNSMADEMAAIKSRLGLLHFNEPMIYETGGINPAAPQNINDGAY